MKMKKIINMTPHEISLFKGENDQILFPSMGTIRLSSTIEMVEPISTKDGEIPMTKTVFGKAENLPVYKEDTYYIVSAILCQAYPHRKDFIMTNQTIRDENGVIVGCKSFTINPFGN